MIIRLEQLVPLPLLEQDTHASDVWNAGEVEFESGTHRVIEAPSGKGKTSLLSILYGLRKDYRGTLRIDGQDAREFGRRRWSELRKTRFAYIFQGLELFPDLSAEENIQLKNRITDRRSRVDILHMAEALEVDPFLSRKAGILSFGQQQRVAIIRALCQPFDFLLADECFSHVDRVMGARALDLICGICREENAAMLLTSLNPTELPPDFHRIRL